MVLAADLRWVAPLKNVTNSTTKMIPQVLNGVNVRTAGRPLNPLHSHVLEVAADKSCYMRYGMAAPQQLHCLHQKMCGAASSIVFCLSSSHFGPMIQLLAKSGLIIAKHNIIHRFRHLIGSTWGYKLKNNSSKSIITHLHRQGTSVTFLMGATQLLSSTPLQI